MNNWQASNRPQEKPKKRLRKLQEWNKAMNLLRTRLRKGINYDDKDPLNKGLFAFYGDFSGMRP